MIESSHTLFHTVDQHINHHVDTLHAVLLSVEKKLDEAKEDDSVEARVCERELETMRRELREEEKNMWEQLAALTGHPAAFVRSYIEIRHPCVLSVSDNTSVIYHLLKEIDYIDARRKELVAALQKELAAQHAEITTGHVYHIFSVDTALHSLIDGAVTLYERAKKEDAALWSHAKKQLDLLLSENILFFLGTNHVAKAVAAWKRLSDEKRNHAEAARIVAILLEDHEERGMENNIQKHAALTELVSRFYDRIKTV